MGLGTSLLLIAVGAVLRWAVTATTSGVNLHTIGLILMIVGGVGFIIAVFWMVNAADRRRADYPSAAYPEPRGPDARPPETRL